MNIRQILLRIDQLAPFRLAESWDNVGLQIGDPQKNITKILVCLEVTQAVINEAKRKKAQLIVAHHPLIFSPLKSITTDHPIAALATELIRNDIALIASHTNLDRSPVGVNTALAEKIDLHKTDFLLPCNPEKLLKLSVFVPEGYETKIIEAIHDGGGGVIGEYDHCTFRSHGVGTFKGNQKTKPAIGKKGNLESVEEWRLEAMIPKTSVRKVIENVCRVHPYEEVAYDLFPLENPGNIKWGYGRIGNLEKSMTKKSFINHVKKVLAVKSAQWIGKGNVKSISRVACFGGSVGSMIAELSRLKFDVLVTGELNHHAAQEAADRGMQIVCVGHFASEIPIAKYFTRILQQQDTIKKSGIKVIASAVEKDPITSV